MREQGLLGGKLFYIRLAMILTVFEGIGCGEERVMLATGRTKTSMKQRV